MQHQHDAASGSLQVYRNSGDGNWLDQPVDGDTLSHFELSGLRWREVVQPWQGGKVQWALDVDQMKGKVNFNNFMYFNGPTLRLTSPYLGVTQQLKLADGWVLQPSAGVRYYQHNILDSKTAPQAAVQLLSVSPLSQPQTFSRCRDTAATASEQAAAQR